MNAFLTSPGAEKKYWREPDARRELASWASSGLSLRKYCEVTGMSESKLRRWKRRLEQQDADRKGFDELIVQSGPVAMDVVSR